MKLQKQNDRVKALLQGSGLRLTRQRCLLGNVLFDGTHKHMTAEQVHAAAHKNCSRTEETLVSLATVYNTLHQFTTAGLLHEVVIDRNRIYFDTNIDPHHHFFDETGGALMDVPASAIDITRLPKIPTGSRLDRVAVVIHIRSEK